jgi:hypothetical protein
MPNSQIDMVVRDDDGVRWNVCLEAFTWAQRIDVLWRRADGNPGPVFGQPETVSQEHELQASQLQGRSGRQPPGRPCIVRWRV